MKFLLLLILLIDPIKLRKINQLKEEAKQAYEQRDFKKAVTLYRTVRDSLGVQDDNVTLNLANAYFQLRDTTYTPSLYQSLSASEDKKIQSVAAQQLGVMANRNNKPEEALEHFKRALQADPTNQDASYNYEMVKKKLNDKKNQPDKNQDNKDQKKDQKQNDKKDQKQDQKNQNNQNKQNQKNDQQKQDQKQNQQEQKNQQDSKKDKQDEQKQSPQNKPNEQKKGEKEKQNSIPPEKLKQMKMTEENAKMILEAMKNQEVQYLQQNRRKATKPRESGKPDW